MNHTHGWIWLSFALLATAVGQLVFKKSSLIRSRSLMLVAAAIFCIAPVASYMALHVLTLATVYVSTALSQLVVVLASFRLFGERYVLRQWGALCLILAGVIVFNSSAFL